MSNLQMSKRKMRQIRPTNIGKNEWSFKEGTPQIEFQMKGTEIVIGSTMRLNGVFEVFTASKTKPTNNKDVVSKQNVNIDSRIGLHSVLENITLNNATTGRNYEIVKHYNRLVSTLQPKQTSQSDYVGGGVDINGATSKSENTGNLCNRKLSFSLPLHCGMLKEKLDLSLLGGLEIILDLASDSFVLNDTNYKDATDTSAQGSYYKLKDLVLSYDAIIPSAQAQQAMARNTSGSFNYTSFASYYTTIVGSDSNHIFNLNSSYTQSIMMNIIPSKWINNYQRNSSSTTPLLNQIGGTGSLVRKATIKDITFLRNNMKFPLDFTIPAKEFIGQTNNPNANLIFEDINSVRVPSKNVSALISPVNVRGFGNVRPNSAFYFPTSNKLGSNDPVFNLSIGYDNIKGLGVNMKNSPFGFRVRSNLTHGTDNPHSVYLFVKQLNTLQISNGAIQTST
tara:strand:+ start:4251 stop:5600 length:1350 start_codon:yes stop_codon:yes gene_type:complete